MKIRSPNQLDALLSIAQVRKRCCFEQDAGPSHSTHWVAYRRAELERRILKHELRDWSSPKHPHPLLRVHSSLWQI